MSRNQTATKTREQTGTERIRIVLADDHAMIREGLRNLFSIQPDVKVVGEATTGKDAIKMALSLNPDVLIIGVSLKDPSSMEVIQKIVSCTDRVKVIVISLQMDYRQVEGMLKAGASGYLVKESSFEELTTAVRTVVQGQNYLTPGITKTVIQGYLNMTTAGTEQPGGLSSRECEVLRSIGEGMRTKGIAERLNLSVKTVETYRRRLMEKLNIYSMVELIKYAIREGYTTL